MNTFNMSANKTTESSKLPENTVPPNLLEQVKQNGIGVQQVMNDDLSMQYVSFRCPRTLIVYNLDPSRFVVGTEINYSLKPIKPIPKGVFYASKETAEYFGFKGWIEATTTMTIHCTCGDDHKSVIGTKHKELEVKPEFK